MPNPTTIAKSTRFFAPEVSKVYFMLTIASADFVPTRAEMTAGKDITDEIADLNGWVVGSDQLDARDMGSRFPKKKGGMLTVDDSSITFYASQDGDDIRSVLPRGTTGFMMFCDGGDVPGYFADVFPVEVLSNSQGRSLSELSRRPVQFSISDTPAESIAIPTNP
jgi:hypothetical protein